MGRSGCVSQQRPSDGKALQHVRHPPLEQGIVDAFRIDFGEGGPLPNLAPCLSVIDVDADVAESDAFFRRIGLADGEVRPRSDDSAEAGRPR